MGKLETIKVGFCVAYDWSLLANSLPAIYKDEDIICLSIDKTLKSWSGNQYPFDEKEFRSFVEANEPSNKIKIYEDDFFISVVAPMENEVRQRNMIA